MDSETNFDAGRGVDVMTGRWELSGELRASTCTVSSQQAQVRPQCGNEPAEKVCEHVRQGERWMEDGEGDAAPGWQSESRAD